MRKVIWLLVALLVLASAAWALCPGIMDCPIHSGWKANFMGTRMIDGVLVGVYHCPFGSSDSPSGHNFVVKCP